MNHYAIYVSDDAGWAAECPNSRDVFFGDHGAQYVRWPHLLEDDQDARLSLGRCGFLVVRGHAAAMSIARALGQSGDWVDPAGDESRPSYAVHRLHGDGTLSATLA